MSYEAFRHFADSYGLAAMAVMFVGLCGWVFLPGPRDRGEKAAHSIFNEDHNDG